MLVSSTYSCVSIHTGVKVSRYDPVLCTTNRFGGGSQYQEDRRAATCYEALIQNQARPRNRSARNMQSENYFV